MILYTCSYIPLEILLGCGREFRRLLSAPGESCHDLGCNFCGYARTVYERGMELGEEDLLVIADSCDAMRRVGDLLQERAAASVFVMRLPWKRDERAVQFMKLEIERLTEFLSLAGMSVDHFEGVSKFNDLVDHVQSLQENLRGHDLTALYLSALEGKKYRPGPGAFVKTGHKKKLGLFGGLMDAHQIDRFVEGAGGEIVYNATCLGKRPFSRKCGHGSDLVLSIAERLLRWRSPCGRFCEEELEEFSKFDGALYAVPKFCDFYNFLQGSESPRVYRTEVDYPLNSHGQLATRIGALLEKNAVKASAETDSKPERRDGMIFVGLDSGSTTTNGLLIDAAGKILEWETVRTGINAATSARKLYEDLLARSGKRRAEVTLAVATGYGRSLIDFADETVTEISCHARGVFELFPGARGVIDIGGQDSKVIRLNRNGAVEDFSMNDRCAAGTGRFLEVMAKVLELKPEEMASLALSSSKELAISSVCTVFAESEVVSLIGGGERIEDIAAALFRAIVKRVSAMYARLASPTPLVFTGGVAKNEGVVRAMERSLDTPITVPKIPDIVGAYGAALFALDSVSGEVRS